MTFTTDLSFKIKNAKLEINLFYDKVDKVVYEVHQYNKKNNVEYYKSLIKWLEINCGNYDFEEFAYILNKSGLILPSSMINKINDKKVDDKMYICKNNNYIKLVNENYFKENMEKAVDTDYTRVLLINPKDKQSYYLNFKVITYKCLNCKFTYTFAQTNPSPVYCPMCGKYIKDVIIDNV